MIFDDQYKEGVFEKLKVHDVFPIEPCFQFPSEEPFQEQGAQMEEEQIEKFEEKDSSKETQIDDMTEVGLMRTIDNKYPVFWSGLMTKSLKNNVVVDGHFVSGDFTMASEEMLTSKMHNLNLTLRSNIEEITRRTPLALIILVPSNSTQRTKFNDEYRNYFKEKKIVGIVNHFKNKIVYIFPYYEELKDLIPGLRDGQYMIAMISEIIKKEDLQQQVVANQQGAQNSQKQENPPQNQIATNQDQSPVKENRKMDEEVVVEEDEGNEQNTITEVVHSEDPSEVVEEVRMRKEPIINDLEEETNMREMVEEVLVTSKIHGNSNEKKSNRSPLKVLREEIDCGDNKVNEVEEIGDDEEIEVHDREEIGVDGDMIEESIVENQNDEKTPSKSEEIEVDEEENKTQKAVNRKRKKKKAVSKKKVQQLKKNPEEADLNGNDEKTQEGEGEQDEANQHDQEAQSKDE